MTGARRGTLARRLTIGFLAVTLPGTVVLGVVTLYSIRSLVVVNRQLEEISLSLEATEGLHLVLTQVAAPPREYLLRGGQGREQEFGRLIRVAEQQRVSCASAACHGVSRTPKEMAALLAPTIEQLRTKGRLIFETALPGRKSNALLWMGEIDQLVSGTSQQLQRMSAALVLRVEALRQQSHEVSRQASVLIASLTLAIILLACGMAVILAKRISRPLQGLLLGTRRVMAGDWGYRVRVRDSGEIGELAASFNAMVDELGRHRERVEEHSRTLEERVRQRTEELRKKDEQLLQSEKLASLGLLASGVAHELNNPLTSILMTTNLILEDLPPRSELRRDLQKVNEDASRVKRIIDDLRVFARRHELEKTLCDLNALVEKTLGLVRHELALKEIRVAQDLADGLPSICCDPNRIQQVLTNVFVNAIQAMEGGGTLTINTAVKEGELVEIAVRDTGPGIPKETRPRIFDPFFTTKRNGTGLGLSISYGIVQEHGGGIEVESITGEEFEAEGRAPGTTVRILLPIERAGP
ncbi:MAG: sensor histidine kinase [Candidatus Methylomirabilales bacterium]